MSSIVTTYHSKGQHQVVLPALPDVDLWNTTMTKKRQHRRQRIRDPRSPPINNSLFSSFFGFFDSQHQHDKYAARKFAMEINICHEEQRDF